MISVRRGTSFLVRNFPAALALFLAAGTFPLFSESLPAVRKATDGSGVSAAVEWEGKKLVLRISEKIRNSGRNPISASYSAERFIQSHLEDYFLTALSDLQVTSRETIGSLSLRDPVLTEGIRELARRAVKSSGERSVDFSVFTAVYTVPLYPDIMNLTVRHSRPYSPPRTIDYASTTAFTGIVVYARGSLPVQGESGTALLVPCLQPKIYDEKMNLLLTSEMVAPETLVSRGVATYSAKDDGATVEAVAGANPLYVMAEKLFGTKRTDIVIPREEAERLLSQSENRKLLTSGKILIVCDLP